MLAVAAVAVALALQMGSGMYDPVALALVTVACALAVSGALWRRRSARPENALVPQAVLGAGCAAGLLCNLFVNPTFYGDPRSFQGGFRGFALVSSILLSAYLCIHLRASLIRARFLLLLACFAVMGIVVLQASPTPWIDVWHFQQGAASTLLHGSNPYTATYPDLYGTWSRRFYASQILRGGRVAAFPYSPLTILAGLPGFAALGDVRYSLLALMIGSAWLLARALPGVTGELAALLLLFQPRAFFVLEQAWTEPLVMFCFALAVYAVARRAHWALAGGALGLLAASKQYSPFLVVPLGLLVRPRRGLWAAAAVLAAVTLPFVLGDPAGFWRGVVQLQFLQPFRADSLSLTSLWVRQTAGALPPLPVLGVALGAAVLLLCLRPRLGVGLACAAAAAAWAAVLIWNKQAFCNYWWLCSGLLGAAAAASGIRETA
jgi:hypothetical protein